MNYEPPHQLSFSIMFFVYLLKSLKDDKLYIGYTSNLRKRIEEHNAGKSTSTKSRIPFKLIYYEAYSSGEDALHREQNLKLQSRALTQLKKRLMNTLRSSSKLN